ncbi:MAG: hypothetical protein ABIK49_03240 [candidate division WOR-3 bacterium]
MRKWLLLLIPLALFAQVEIDTVIYLPSYLCNGFFIPELNKLYVLGWNELYVLDCSTYELRARLPRYWELGYGDFSYSWRRQKVYLGVNPKPCSIMVIDAVADTLIGWIPKVWSSNEYVSSNDRLYCPQCSPQWSFRVIDCSTDSIIKEIPPPYPAVLFFGPTWDSLYNRLFVGINNFWQGFWGIAVYDCTNDSLLAVVDLHRHISPARLNFFYKYNKAYYTPCDNVGGYMLPGVIDLNNYSVKFFPFAYQGDDCANPVGIDTVDDKVYIPERWESGVRQCTLFVIDPNTDSIINKVIYRDYPVEVLVWVPWSNRLYFSNMWFNLWVLDCSTDSIIARLQLSRTGEYAGPCDIQLDPIRQRIFAIGCDSNAQAVYVLRDVVPGVEEKKVEMSGNLSLPTVIRNVLRWEPVSGHRSSVLLDVSGRKVLDLLPGVNDVRHLAPGVYFIEIGSSIERKVVVVK